MGREPTRELRRQVDAALRAEVSRFLDSHGGAVVTAKVSEHGDVTLQFRGACQACPAVAATFYSKVAPVVQGIPGVRSVSTPNVNVSEAAARRILAISTRRPEPERPTP